MRNIDFEAHFVTKECIQAMEESTGYPRYSGSENIFVTTSGNYLAVAFTGTVETLGIDSIFRATDYPYKNPSEGVQILEGLPLTRDEWERIYFRNAGQSGTKEEWL